MTWAVTVRSQKRLQKGSKYTKRVRARASKSLRVGCLLAAFTMLFVTAFALTHFVEEDDVGFTGSLRRRLMGAQANCNNALDMVGDPGAKGALAIPVYITVILWFFIGLASVTDDFFVPALVVISEKLDLSESVAGATFMAAGSSAPELFTNLADISTYGNSTGIGTIVGSAVFNILVIIACAAAFAKSALQIDWRPMARDVGFYLASIFLLFVFVQGWGSTPAPLHAFQYSKGDHDATAISDGLPTSYPGTTPRVWYKDAAGAEFADAQPLSFSADSGEVTQGTICCDQVSADGTYCVKPSGNGGRMFVDTDRPYLHDEYHAAGIFKSGNDCTALKDQDAVNFPQFSETLRFKGKEVLFCCDPAGVQVAYPYVELAGKAATETQGGGRAYIVGRNGYIKPTFDPLLNTPTCAVPVTRWECACDAGEKVFPTAYTHGKPVCEGELQSEGRITWWEALIMVLSYGLYICWMFKNKELLMKCPGELSKQERAKERMLARARNTGAAPDSQQEQDSGDEGAEDEVPERRKSNTESDRLQADSEDDQDGSKREMEEAVEEGDEKNEDDDKDDEEEEATGCCLKCMGKFLDITTCPWTLMFTYTIPDCNFEDEEAEMKAARKEDGAKKYSKEDIKLAKVEATKWYMVSFFMSILWIGGMSIVMVLFANWLGCLVGISNIIMGVTVLAAGTSVPDALGSIITARDGLGDMAVANAIGSNVFDILLALGFPYFLSYFIKGQPYCVDTSGVIVHILILFSTVIAVVAIFAVVGWRLTKSLGAVMLFLYAGFLIYSIVDGVRQQDEIEHCQTVCTNDPNDTRCLGNTAFLRNPGHGGLYDIYAQSNGGNHAYDFFTSGTSDNICPDICGNRYAKADL